MKKGVQLQTGNTIGMQWYPKKIAFVSSVFVLAFMLIFSNQRNAIVYASIALIPSEQCSGDFNGASHASGFSDLPEMNEESFSGTNAASTSTPNATLVCHVFNGAIPETSEQKLVLNISWVMRPAATTEFFEHTPEPTMSASQLQSDIDTNTDTVVADLDGNTIIFESEPTEVILDQPEVSIDEEPSLPDVDPSVLDDIPDESLEVDIDMLEIPIDSMLDMESDNSEITPEISEETLSFFWNLFTSDVYAQELPELVESQEEVTPIEQPTAIDSATSETLTVEETTSIPLENTIQADLEDATETVIIDFNGTYDAVPVVTNDVLSDVEVVEASVNASPLQSDIDTNTDTVVADLDGEVHIIRDHIIPVPPRENIPSSSLVEILYSLGDGWQTLDVIDEVDGLASFELPHTVVAGDLSNLTVAIRNLQQLSDRTLYIDAVWIDVQIPEDQITKKQSQEVITRKYDVPFVVNSLATHRCSSEQFNINLSAKRSTSVILDLSYDYSQSSHSLTIGSLPAGIDVRFTESDDYQYILSEQEDVVHLDITRVQDAIHGNFTIPIIFTETGEVDSITTCQINIIH